MGDNICLELTDRDSMLDALEKILDMSPVAQTELVIEAERSSLTRFAGNRIHQNVAQTDCQLSVRVIENGCIGSASVNQFDRKSIQQALEWAHAVARSGRLFFEPGEFANPSNYADIDNYAKVTAEFSPHDRGVIANSLIEDCSSAGAEAAGAVSNGENALAVVNSNGLRAHHAMTDADFTATVSVDGSTAWCDCCSTNATLLDAQNMGRHTLDRALAGRKPGTVKPGRHTVILEEAAVKDFLDFLCWLGFGAQAFLEKRSFMYGKIGEKITGENITIVDDAFDSRNAGIPFDYEGVPKERVVLIEKGIAREIVYDRTYAVRAGRSSTGHALPARFTFGPLPLNIVMSPGDAEVTEMIRSVERGLLVSRFWYCRVVDPARTLLTGQTRDGTFLIENGQITGGVRDMRFNESVLEAFTRAEMISSRMKRVGSVLTPALKISDFRFTEVVGKL